MSNDPDEPAHALEPETERQPGPEPQPDPDPGFDLVVEEGPGLDTGLEREARIEPEFSAGAGSTSRPLPLPFASSITRDELDAWRRSIRIARINLCIGGLFVTIARLYQMTVVDASADKINPELLGLLRLSIAIQAVEGVVLVWLGVVLPQFPIFGTLLGVALLVTDTARWLSAFGPLFRSGGAGWAPISVFLCGIGTAIRMAIVSVLSKAVLAAIALDRAVQARTPGAEEIE